MKGNTQQQRRANVTITATWVPGFEVAEAPAGDAGDYTGGPPKLVWHTSETVPGSLDGIVSDRKSVV